MSKTVYITRNGQIVAGLSDNEYSDGVLRGAGHIVGRAPHYAQPRLDIWEADALHVFSDFIRDVGLDGDWEYCGSPCLDDGDPVNGMTVAVIESPIGDFSGDQITALVEHPDTVFHGYVRFVDQQAGYVGALFELEDVTKRSCDPTDIERAVSAVLLQDREHYDACSDIADTLRECGRCYPFEVGMALRRVPEAVQ